MSKTILIFFLSIMASYLITSHLVEKAILFANADTVFERQLNALISRDANLNIARQTFSNLRFKKNKDSNLYLTLYNEVAIRSRSNAIRGTAALEGLSISQVERALSEGILPAQSSDTVEQTNQKVESIRSTYQFEKALFQDLTYLQMKTMAFEIFANGSRSDSGFDLINDMNDIEKLLFVKRSPSQFDGSINIENSKAKSLADSGYTGGFSLSQTPPPETQTPPAAPDQEEPEDTEPLALTANALTCPIDITLQENFNQFETRTSQLTAQQQDSQSVASSDLSSPTSAFQRPLLRDFTPTAPRCNLGGFSSDYLVFCVRTEVVRDKARSYFPEIEDCIACQIQQIARITDELNSQSFIPQKITGNMGEPAVCKNHVFPHFTMNISLIPAPARSDLEIIETVREITTADIIQAPAEPTLQPTTEEILTRTAQGEDVLASSILANEGAAIDAIQSDESTRLITASITPSLDTSSNFINQMNQRLTAFQQNFEQFRDQIIQINNILIQISQKGVCR